MAKFKTDQPVIHVKSLVRGTVQSHDGDKVTYIKEDGTTSTVNASSLMTVTKWEADKAKEQKKADAAANRDKIKAEREAARKNRTPASKEGYRKSGMLEYDPKRYTPRAEVKTASGNKVSDIGDTAADQLAGASFEEMVAIVSRVTGRAKADLIAKYENLNPGQRRMTLGNILRAANKQIAAGIDPKAPKPKAAKAADAKPAKEKPAKPAKPAKPKKGEAASA